MGSLHQRIMHQIRQAHDELDRRYEQAVEEHICEWDQPCEPDYGAIDRIDAYISGLEKLLTWEAL